MANLNSKIALPMPWDEAEKLLRGLLSLRDKKYALFVAIALYTGLRSTDILYLKWGDIKRRSSKNWYIEIEETKTKKRAVKKLQPFIIALFNTLRDKGGFLRYIEPEEYIFGVEDWGFYNTKSNACWDNFRKKICKNIKKFCPEWAAEQPFVGIRTLRKTYAMRFMEIGNKQHQENPKKYPLDGLTMLCLAMNHSNIKQTMLYLGMTVDIANEITMEF